MLLGCLVLILLVAVYRDSEVSPAGHRNLGGRVEGRR